MTCVYWVYLWTTLLVYVVGKSKSQTNLLMEEHLKSFFIVLGRLLSLIKSLWVHHCVKYVAGSMWLPQFLFFQSFDYSLARKCQICEKLSRESIYLITFWLAQLLLDLSLEFFSFVYLPMFSLASHVVVCKDRRRYKVDGLECRFLAVRHNVKTWKLCGAAIVQWIRLYLPSCGSHTIHTMDAFSPL